MARAAANVSTLVEDEPKLAEALSTVLQRTEEQDTIEWGDVNDELSSGQWGRLIEQEILVDNGGGFELADREAVENALGDSDDVEVSDDDSGWTMWDKAAAVGSVLLFLGYSQRPVRNAVGETIDIFLGPLDQALPFYLVILTISVLTGLYSTLLQANLMDTEKMSEIQGQMQEIQDRRKAAKERGDDEALEEIKEEQMEAMGDQLGMFKLQFRPMVWIMLLTVPAFLWMYWKILSGGGDVVGEVTVVMPFIGDLAAQDQWTTSVIGPMQAWIVWYFLCSMAFTQVIRKSLNVQTTPSS
ncbi:MAG: DUF106 domain-containing protein [Halobacteriales archaeon]